tara:strand:- start:879 stop:1115 length:237 start_codon:yes stop_codon:yes gene_type:complete
VDGENESEFKIGDLVKGYYDFEITYWFVDADTDVRIFYGVIIKFGEVNIHFPYGNFFYQVLCTDGIVRFFTEWEIKKV